MSPKIEVTIDKIRVGDVTFKQDLPQLVASRTAAGFNLIIPASITLELAESSQPCPMLSNLRGVISSDGTSGTPMELGTARDDSWYTGAVPKWSGDAHLTWSGNVSALLWFEKLRDTRPPRFKIELHGEVCWLLSPSDRKSDSRTRTEPQPLSGSVEIAYPTEVWVRMLRQLGIAENVLVEIPLPSSPPAPWDEVWSALLEARDAFERGGTTGWKGCVSAIRLALEKWQAIEKENMGPGWTSPKREDREARSKRQRLDNLRWHLLQRAHLAPHSGADDWSREDAILAFATLSALLAVRKP